MHVRPGRRSPRSRAAAADRAGSRRCRQLETLPREDSPPGCALGWRGAGVGRRQRGRRSRSGGPSVKVDRPARCALWRTAPASRRAAAASARPRSVEAEAEGRRGAAGPTVERERVRRRAHPVKLKLHLAGRQTNRAAARRARSPRASASTFRRTARCPLPRRDAVERRLPRRGRGVRRAAGERRRAAVRHRAGRAPGSRRREWPRDPCVASGGRPPTAGTRPVSRAACGSLAHGSVSARSWSDEVSRRGRALAERVLLERGARR